jgi:hypothetical protein
MNISNITPTLLEQEPETYLQHLEYCINNNIDVKSIINSKVYSTWYSNHLACLAYLVGELVNDVALYDSDTLSFYGQNSSINDNLGVEILKKLVILGVDLYSKNYYGYTVFDSMQHTSFNTRNNNSLFKKYLNTLRRCPSI